MLGNILNYLSKYMPLHSCGFVLFIADYAPFMGRYYRTLRLPAGMSRKRFCRRLQRHYFKAWCKNARKGDT